MLSLWFFDEGLATGAVSGQALLVCPCMSVAFRFFRQSMKAVVSTGLFDHPFWKRNRTASPS